MVEPQHRRVSLAEPGEVAADKPEEAISVGLLDIEAQPAQAAGAEASSDQAPSVIEADAAIVAAAQHELVMQVVWEEAAAAQQVPEGVTATAQPAVEQQASIAPQTPQGAGVAASPRELTREEALASICGNLRDSNDRTAAAQTRLRRIEGAMAIPDEPVAQEEVGAAIFAHIIRPEGLAMPGSIDDIDLAEAVRTAAYQAQLPQIEEARHVASPSPALGEPRNIPQHEPDEGPRQTVRIGNSRAIDTVLLGLR